MLYIFLQHKEKIYWLCDQTGSGLVYLLSTLKIKITLYKLIKTYDCKSWFFYILK